MKNKLISDVYRSVFSQISWLQTRQRCVPVYAHTARPSGRCSVHCTDCHRCHVADISAANLKIGPLKISAAYKKLCKISFLTCGRFFSLAAEFFGVTGRGVLLRPGNGGFLPPCVLDSQHSTFRSWYSLAGLDRWSCISFFTPLPGGRFIGRKPQKWPFKNISGRQKFAAGKRPNHLKSGLNLSKKWEKRVKTGRTFLKYFFHSKIFFYIVNLSENCTSTYLIMKFKSVTF